MGNNEYGTSIDCAREQTSLKFKIHQFRKASLIYSAAGAFLSMEKRLPRLHGSIPLACLEFN